MGTQGCIFGRPEVFILAARGFYFGGPRILFWRPKYFILVARIFYLRGPNFLFWRPEAFIFSEISFFFLKIETCSIGEIHREGIDGVESDNVG